VLYARSGDVNIAYQVVGTGPIDLVFVMGWVSHLEEFWTEPSFAAFLRRLASRARLILFDKRGTGLSDRVAESELPSLEQRIDDVRAVMEAVGSERAVLLGVSEGGPMCALFAATHPQRSLGLIMIGTYARRTWAPDYPWAPPRARGPHDGSAGTGRAGGIDDRAPSRAHDPVPRQWWHTICATAPAPAPRWRSRANAGIDVRDVLPAIRVPTLVCIAPTTGACGRPRAHKPSASRARPTSSTGNDHLPFVGDHDRLLREIDGFLGFVSDRAEAGSSLATILWVGRDAGTHASAPPVAAVREAVEGFRGAFSSHDDRAWLAAFDGPARGAPRLRSPGRRASGSGVRPACTPASACLRHPHRATRSTSRVAAALARPARSWSRGPS
jgi:pimeloyl-ACP methyl ester carboxylesterase